MIRLVLLPLLGLAASAHAATLVPAKKGVPAAWRDYLRVSPVTPLVRDEDPSALGRWLLTVHDLDGQNVDVALEVVAVPQCGHETAVHYKVGDVHGIAPATSKYGGLDFTVGIGGKNYFVALNADDGALKGSLQTVDGEQSWDAKAVLQGRDVPEGFVVKPVVASQNAIPLLFTSDDGAETWYVRAPQVPQTDGAAVFHKDVSEFYACYSLNASHDQVAFTYSDAPYFVIVMSTLKADEDVLLWRGSLGKSRYQKDPFILSVYDESAGVDLFAAPAR